MPLYSVMSQRPLAQDSRTNWTSPFDAFGRGRVQEDMFCNEFHLVDLRVYDNCLKVCTGCDHVFNLAADMGGMGFIQSNHAVIMYNNTMISFNMLEAARNAGIKR